MFSFLSTYGGYIRAFGLTSFWKKLSVEERSKIKGAYVKSLYPNTMEEAEIDSKDNRTKPEVSDFSFLYGTSVKLFQQKDYELAEKILTVAIKKVKVPVALHQIHNLLIDVYYKQRDTKKDALTRCIAICRKDIQMASVIVKEKQDIPAFKRLAIILESEGDYKGAIKVAKAAMSYGLDDGTKGGYAGRIEKLENKATISAK